MQKFILKTLITAVAALAAAYLIAGVNINNSFTAIIVAVLLGFLNAVVRPILVLLTLPITIFTLGLFLLVINMLIVLWVSDLVKGFTVTSWWAAFWFSIVVSLLSTIMEGIIIKNTKAEH